LPIVLSLPQKSLLAQRQTSFFGDDGAAIRAKTCRIVLAARTEVLASTHITSCETMIHSWFHQSANEFVRLIG
jgi:hypothetical protein